MGAFTQYFVDDPLRILYMIGGSGGIWFWITAWKGRIRVKVRDVTHKYGVNESPRERVLFRFELENLGDATTSIEPLVFVSAYDKDRQRRKGMLKIDSDNRKLEPLTAMTFSSLGPLEDDYLFWIFRKYQIRLTKGRNKTIRFRSQPGQGELSPARYFIELALFRFFGWLPFFEQSSSGPTFKI
ncbi:MAG: hypothetical protein WBN40_03455 [Pseudomonadales bacterium]